MTLNAIFAVFIVSAILATLPGFSKFFGYLDTVIHEVGHGIATTPFGVSFPRIVIRPNASGETRNTLGFISALLPVPLAWMLDKVSRLVTLLSGYSASIILAAIFLKLALIEEVHFSPWFLLALALILLGTVLWSLVRITDSPILFVLAIILIVGISLYYDLGWWVLAIIAGYMILLAFSKTVISSAALGASFAGLLSLIIVGFDLNFPEYSINEYFPTVFTSFSVALTVAAGLSIFALLSVASIFSLGVILASSILLVGSIVQPWWPWEYSVAALAGVLFSSGVRSFIELYKLTFDHPEVETDMVFAEQDFGLPAAVWYWVILAFTVISSAIILK